MNHPQVEIIWNFFPFSIMLWGPIRELANILFSPFRLATLPWELVLNTITETVPFLLTNILMMVFIPPKEWWIIIITNTLLFTLFTNIRMGLLWIGQLISVIVYQEISADDEKICVKDFNFTDQFISGDRSYYASESCD